MRTKKDFERQNEYNKNKYDHVNIMLPKGQKAILQEKAEQEGISLNGLIKKAIDEYMKEPAKAKLSPEKETNTAKN